jgi:hypothetical protein
LCGLAEVRVGRLVAGVEGDVVVVDQEEVGDVVG